MDDILSLWDTGREKILPVQANNHYATIKFTVEIFENSCLDTIGYKGERFKRTSILILPPIRGQSKGFIKGEALRYIRTKSLKDTFKTD